MTKNILLQNSYRMSEKEKNSERISRRKKGKKARKEGRDGERGKGKEGKKEKKGRKEETDNFSNGQKLEHMLHKREYPNGQYEKVLNQLVIKNTQIKAIIKHYYIYKFS